MAQRPKYTSPRCTLGFPCAIDEPDTHFSDPNDPNDKGDYKARLVMEKGSPEQEKFQNELETIWNDHLAAVAAEKGKAIKALKIEDDHIPWVDEMDENGDPTGNVIYRVKLPACRKRRDGTPIEFRPKVFDAKGVLLKEVPNIGPGSEVKVGGEVYCYSKPKIGMRLCLNGVQLLKLVEGVGGKTAGSFGFGEEEGFTDEESMEATMGAGAEGDF